MDLQTIYVAQHLTPAGHFNTQPSLLIISAGFRLEIQSLQAIKTTSRKRAFLNKPDS